MVYGVWCIVSLHLCWCQGSKLCHTSKPYRSNQMWGAMLRRLRHSAWHCLGKLTGRALVGVWLVVRKCLARMYKDEEKILQCYRFCNWYWYCHHRLEAAFVMVATNAFPLNQVPATTIGMDAWDNVTSFWLRERQPGIHILFAILQIQPPGELILSVWCAAADSNHYIMCWNHPMCSMAMSKA